jgi:hypothetical protein
MVNVKTFREDCHRTHSHKKDSQRTQPVLGTQIGSQQTLKLSRTPESCSPLEGRCGLVFTDKACRKQNKASSGKSPLQDPQVGVVPWQVPAGRLPQPSGTTSNFTAAAALGSHGLQALLE